MRIGCHASALQPARKAPYETAVANAVHLGFDGVELIAMDSTELDDYYSPATMRALRKTASDGGVAISQFAVYSTACEGMASLDPVERDKGIKAFMRGIDICHELGCGIVNLVSHWPIGLTAPIEYVPTYVYPIVRGVTRIASPKLRMDMPADFDFDAIWRSYLESLRTCADYAQERGVKFALEGHTHVIVSGTDAMLRLFDQLDHPALVVNFDTSWHFIQREYLPMSIQKLGARIAHVHLRDSDGLLFYGSPVGQGIIDWDGVIGALRVIGYDGFLSFEWGGYDGFLEIAREGKDFIRRKLER